MKILALRGINIASLTEFDVDFNAEPLRSAGVFAITGPTGAGKSSLLDAMCLALYHTAPRTDGIHRETEIDSDFGPISQSDPRNFLRRGSHGSWCECDFRSDGGRIFRSRWGYRPAKRRGAASQEECWFGLVSDGQTTQLSNRKTECEKAVLEHLGLSYEQFTRTVLLAQGQFAQFLKAPENDRVDLLEKLTGTGIYRRISTRVYEKFIEAQKHCGEIKTQLDFIKPPTEEELATREKDRQKICNQLPAQQDRLKDVQKLLRGLEALEGNLQQQQQLEAEQADLQPRREALKEAETVLAEAETAAQKAFQELQPEIADARRLDAALQTTMAQRREREERHEKLQQGLAEAQRKLSATQRDVTQNDEETTKLRESLDKVRERLEPLAPEWPRWKEMLKRLGDNLQARKEAQDSRDRTTKELRQTAERRQKLETELAAHADGSASEKDLQSRIETQRRRTEALHLLLPRLQKIAEKAKIDTDLRDATAHLPESEKAAAAAGAAAETARALVTEMELAHSKDVEGLRLHLKDGACCPVCGSTEHPWAHGTSATDAVLEQQKEKARQLEDAGHKAQQELNRLQAEISSNTKRQQELEAWLTDNPADAGLQQEAQQKPDPSAWAQQELGASRQEEEELNACLRILSSLKTVRAEEDGRKEICHQADARVQESGTAIEADQKELDVPFRGTAWREKFATSIDFVQKTDSGILNFKKNQEDLEKLTQQRKELEAIASQQQSALTEKQTELDAAAKDLAGIQQQEKEQRESRAGLLGGLPVEEIETKRKKEEESFKARREENRSAQQGIETSFQNNSGKLELLRKDGNQNREKSEAERLRLFPETAPEKLKAVAMQEQDALQTSVDQLTRESVSLEHELKEGREKFQKSAKLSQELNSREKQAKTWEALSMKIGAKNGDKFSRIAQRYTLESLLEEANRQLVQIAPRYRLQGIPGSMGIQVIDADNYDLPRPVHTLSGGESFLVSLGMALSLASLSGGSLSVESLFIDEGFGSLDSDSLHHVLAALGNLQAQGRKVGLITHVEEMKEEIPVRIKVVPLGSGSSQVELDG